MSIEDLQRWKDEELNVARISELTGKTQTNIRSQYAYHGIKPFPGYFTPWNFSKIYDSNDPDGLYVIGLLAADGYLNGKAVSIYIQKRDVELLNRIIHVCYNESANIVRRERSHSGPQVGLNIGSIALVNYLTDVYGFSNNKSATLPFPSFLMNPLPYLRGFMDGDGHIGYGCVFSCGSENFAFGLLDWVYKTYKYQPYWNRVGTNGRCINITFRKKHEAFIRDLFSYPGLQRKTEAFFQYLPN